MIRFLDQSWRVAAILIILALWGIAVLGAEAYDRIVDYLEEV